MDKRIVKKPNCVYYPIDKYPGETAILTRKPLKVQDIDVGHFVLYHSFKTVLSYGSEYLGDVFETSWVDIPHPCAEISLSRARNFGIKVKEMLPIDELVSDSPLGVIRYPSEIYPVHLIAPKPYVTGDNPEREKVTVNFTNVTLRNVNYIYCASSPVEKVILPHDYYEAIAYTNELVSIEEISGQDILSKLRYYQSHGDPEEAHVEADNILCSFLKQLGYEDIVRAWEAIEPKWYA